MANDEIIIPNKDGEDLKTNKSDLIKSFKILNDTKKHELTHVTEQIKASTIRLKELKELEKTLKSEIENYQNMINALEKNS